jgi:hypothetical protein
MRHLDLVITTDTAMAHLAGALAGPVWLALSKVSDWHWLLEREDSPWYPTMRLFRQTDLGNWKPVFARMAEDLQPLLGKKNMRPENAGKRPVTKKRDGQNYRTPLFSPIGLSTTMINLPWAS